MSFLQTSIAGLIQKDVPTVAADASVQDAIAQLKSTPYQTVYTVSDVAKKTLAGVITFHELDKLLTSKPETARDIAKQGKMIAIRDNAEVWQLLKIMNGENSLNTKFDRLPVVDANNALLGIVDRNRVRSALDTSQIAVSGQMLY
jgi:CBS domain-containing protein